MQKGQIYNVHEALSQKILFFTSIHICKKKLNALLYNQQFKKSKFVALMHINTQSLTRKKQNQTKPVRDVKFSNGAIMIGFGLIRGNVAMRTFLQSPQDKYLLPVLGMI